MEQILNVLKEEIKKVTSEEKMNTGKLAELLQIYRRVEGYTVSSVGQVHPIRPFDQDFGAFPIVPPVRNETATLYDGILKSFQELYKAQTPNVSGTQIMRYIEWYEFIQENIEPDISNDREFDICNKLYKRILDDIEKEIDKKDNKDEVKEKSYEHVAEGVKNQIEQHQKEE